MAFAESVLHGAREALPGIVMLPLLMIPFIVAEQIWPVERRPRFGDYWLNILVSITTTYLALPIGVAAGLLAGALRRLLPWRPVGFSFDSIGAIPHVGGALELLAMIFVPLLVHDLWFYWAHRIEHRVPLLWEFHKIHHSDPLMNASTFGRDHFLQAAWIGFFPLFTLGLIFELDAVQTGEAALYSMLFLTLLSMFYHSAIRVRVRWMDRLLVTPQVHRIHHSLDPAHHNRNFADALPIMDILFGTYHRPARDEFPATGLGEEFPAPRSLWAAQARPVARAFGARRAAKSPAAPGARAPSP